MIEAGVFRRPSFTEDLMNKKIVTTVVAAGVVMAVAFAGPAFASTPSTPSKTPATLASIQAKGAAETAKRVTSLTAALTKSNANKSLSSADKATIAAHFAAASNGEKALGLAIAADTTIASARADVNSIYSRYRVYEVVLPQAHIAEVADVSTTGLLAAQTKLTARLAGKDKSKSTPALQADLADVTSQLATISSDSTGLSASALAVTAASYNANHSVLTADRAAAKAIRAAVKKAHADLKTVRTAIK